MIGEWCKIINQTCQERLNCNNCYAWLGSRKEKLANRYIEEEE